MKCMLKPGTPDADLVDINYGRIRLFNIEESKYRYCYIMAMRSTLADAVHLMSTNLGTALHAYGSAFQRRTMSQEGTELARTEPAFLRDMLIAMRSAMSEYNKAMSMATSVGLRHIREHQVITDTKYASERGSILAALYLMCSACDEISYFITAVTSQTTENEAWNKCKAIERLIREMCSRPHNLMLGGLVLSDAVLDYMDARISEEMHAYKDTMFPSVTERLNKMKEKINEIRQDLPQHTLLSLPKKICHAREIYRQLRCMDEYMNKTLKTQQKRVREVLDMEKEQSDNDEERFTRKSHKAE